MSGFFLDDFFFDGQLFLIATYFGCKLFKTYNQNMSREKKERNSNKLGIAYMVSEMEFYFSGIEAQQLKTPDLEANASKYQ